MEERHPSLLITKNRNKFLRDPNPTQYTDWPDTSGDASWKGSSSKSKLGKSSSKSLISWILMVLELPLILIVTIPSLVWQAFTRLLWFSFLAWYASDSFILVKFSLIKKGLLLGLNVYFFYFYLFIFFLTWDSFFLLYRACLAC